MISWILCVVAVEAVTEIVVTSEIFLRLRNFIAKISDFFGGLVGCGYCLSVWISASIAWALPGVVTDIWCIDFIIKVFVLHRASNALHELLSRWFSRLPWFLMISNPQVNNDDDVIGDDDGEVQA